MNKRGLILFFGVLLVLSIALGSAEVFLDSEVKKVTYYAEDYEAGNINYAQLLVYLSQSRENLNKLLGATKYEGGVLKQEQLKQVLGKPTEDTNWVWVEREEREMMLSKSVPVWKKIIFDGKKIQIRLGSYPSIIKKKDLIKEKEDVDKSAGENEKKEIEENIKNFEDIGEGKFLIYRLNFEIEFKRAEEKLDISSEIGEIKSLAEKFNVDASRENGDILAKESVNAERAFESFFRQSSKNCEDVMVSIFGSENKRKAEKMTAQEINFYDDEKYRVKIRIEMCDDCQWKWINLDAWVEGRGAGVKAIESEQEMISSEEFNNMAWEDFERETRSFLEKYKEAIKKKDLGEANRLKSRMWLVNEAWNRKSNDVWKEVNAIFEQKKTGAMQEQQEEYAWLKEEQERRKMVKEIMDKNYGKRKKFYEELFKDYDRKEYHFEQIGYEKRLIEEFKEFGEEICDNNLDDNKNEKVDCDDEQCGGKVCGYENVILGEGNETHEEKQKLYCISGSCQAKKEIVVEKKAVCGNNICEENEAESCAKDCVTCAAYEPINCSGRIMFSGKDDKGCPLNPVCIEEDMGCNVNEDCKDPLCGDAACIEGKCKVVSLNECKEAECSDGQEKIQNCASGEKIIVRTCFDSLWKETNVRCSESEEKKEEIADKPSVGSECTVKSDCGGENDVCSNGICVTVPERVEEARQEPEQEVSREEQIIENFNFVKSTTGKIITVFANPSIIGKSITGFQGEEEKNSEIPIKETVPTSESQPTTREEPTFEPEPQPSPPPEGCPDVGSPPETQKNCWYENRYDERGCVSGYDVKCEEHKGEVREEIDRRDREERNERENERRCGEDCERRCKENLIYPCVNSCVRKECGDEFECNVDEAKKKCEESCKAEKNLGGCVSECVGKCKKGEEFELERAKEDENKEEKGVFMAGGQCRTSKQKTEGFIYFNGWGEPFEKIQPLKQKYYSGGDADWCKNDLENLKKQRAEFEKGFNQEFVKWFFEKYLANSADDWEQHVSGMFELYWKDVELSREMAKRMGCLGINEVPEHNLINVKYETEYGSLEFWEELKTVKLEEMEKEVTVISPYMKIWIFPPEEFIKNQMKRAMEKHEFPGPQDENSDSGPAEEEKEMIKRDKSFMKKLKKVTDKYNGNINGVIQLKDYNNNEVLFNLYVKVNENDIIEMEPMKPEEAPKEDVKVVIDFEKVYEMIYIQEKEMRGAQIESPPWDKKVRPIEKFNEIKNGIKMWFKVQEIINSAEIAPESAKSDVKTLFKSFFSMVMKSEGGGPPTEKESDERSSEGTPWEDKESVTGEVVRVS